MPTIPYLTRDCGLDSVSSCLRESGCVIIESLAPASLINDIDCQIAPLLAQASTENHDFGGNRTKRLNGLLARAPACQQLALHPLILGATETTLGPYCARYQLNFDGVMCLLPGERAQNLHRDGLLYPFKHPTVPYIVACMWAHTDFTIDNGATWVVPRSHDWPQDAVPGDAEPVCAEMPRGSVLIYTGNVFHGAGSNRSDAPRCGIAIQYNYAWLRQELNMYLTYPPEIAKQLPEALQRLIGYELAAPYLGYVDGGNPHIVLEDPTPKAVVRNTPELAEANSRIGTIAFATDRKH